MRRTKIQRELDLRKTAELYLKGHFQDYIAQKLGVTQQQISKDIKTLTDRWQKAGVVDIDIAKQKELEIISMVQRECWDAWDRSKADKTKKQLKSKDGNSGNKASANEKVLQTETSIGDAKFLDLILSSSKERSKLLGTYAPLKSKNEHVFEPIEINYITPIDDSFNDSIDDNFDDEF